MPSNNQAPPALGLILKVDVGSGIQTEIEFAQKRWTGAGRLGVRASGQSSAACFTSHSGD
jgi:hypothetical protein